MGILQLGSEVGDRLEEVGGWYIYKYEVGKSNDCTKGLNAQKEGCGNRSLGFAKDNGYNTGVDQKNSMRLQKRSMYIGGGAQGYIRELLGMW